MKKSLFINLFALFILSASAQNNNALRHIPKHTIWITTNEGNVIKGVLISTSDSSVEIYPGKKSEYGKQLNISTVKLSYLNIAEIQIRKKNALLNGLLIGAGFGLAPVLMGPIFGKSTGEGGAYVSIIAFPLGIITGVITGIASRKTFLIGGEKRKFYAFHKKMKY
jgi:hypothetical protein